MRTNGGPVNKPRARQMIALAGPEVERRVTGRYDRVSSSTDWRNARYLATYQAGSDDEVEPYVHWMTERTRTLIRFPPFWQQVQALTSVLLDRGSLSYRAARKVCDQH